MNRYMVCFVEEEMEIEAGSMGGAEEMAKNLISRSYPDRHVTYIVRNSSGESRYGSVRAKYI